jgi:hypothetical protein
MKRVTKVVVSVVLGIGVISAVTAGYRHHHWGDPEKRAEWVMERVENKLELSAGQVAKLDALFDELMLLRNDFHQEKEAKQQQLLDLVAADTLNQQTLLDMVMEKTQTVDQQAPAVITALAGFTDSLDNSQRRKLVEMLEWRLGGWHH